MLVGRDRGLGVLVLRSWGVGSGGFVGSLGSIVFLFAVVYSKSQAASDMWLLEHNLGTSFEYIIVIFPIGSSYMYRFVLGQISKSKKLAPIVSTICRELGNCFLFLLAVSSYDRRVMKEIGARVASIYVYTIKVFLWASLGFNWVSTQLLPV